MNEYILLSENTLTEREAYHRKKTVNNQSTDVPCSLPLISHNTIYLLLVIVAASKSLFTDRREVDFTSSNTQKIGF